MSIEYLLWIKIEKLSRFEGTESIRLTRRVSSKYLVLFSNNLPVLPLGLKD